MSITKKIISFCLVAFLMSTIIPFSAIAVDDTLNIVVSSKECYAGSTIEVPISLKSNPGISSLRFKVHFDSYLTLKNVSYNENVTGQTIQPENYENPVTLMWVSPFENYSQDAEFAVLTFKVAENAPENKNIEISVTYDPNDIYNMAEVNVPCVITEGKVTIASDGEPDADYIAPIDEDVVVDYENKLVHVNSFATESLSEILNVLKPESVKLTKKKPGFIGTGSNIAITKEKRIVNYTVVVNGDVDGDSVCDSLDIALVEMALNGNIDVTNESLYAATGNIADELNVNAFQRVVNIALSREFITGTYTVIFKDYDGTVLKKETVSENGSVVPPIVPERSGYVFVGWDDSINDIKDNIVLTARYAQVTGPAFVVEHVTATPGEKNVAVRISLLNNPNIASIGMRVEFPDSLVLKNVEYNTDFGGQSVLPQKFESPTKLTWVSPFENVSIDDVFVTLYFDISEQAVGEIPIEITYNSDDVYDMSEKNVSFEVVNNSILVVG